MLLDWVKLDVVFARSCFAKRAATQLAMNRIYTADADIYLAFRLQVTVV